MVQFLRRFEKILALAALSLAFYLFARLEFVVWNWPQYKSKEVSDILWAFFVGFRFDIAAICMSLVPVVLWSFWPWSEKRHYLWATIAFWLFAPFFLAFMMMNLGDSEFINFVGRRFSYDALFVVGEMDTKVAGILGSYWHLAVINFSLMGFLIWVAWKILHRPSKRAYILGLKWELPYYIVGVFIVLVMTVVGVRGGLQRKPLNIVNAHIFAAPILNNLVLNSTFTFIKSYGAEKLGKEVYFSDRQEMLKNLNGSLPGPSLLEGKRPKPPQNVVVIILESFSLEYMGEINGGQGFTPFLDSLAHKGLFFKNSFANARRSIEGVAAVTAGIPAMMNEPFISSHFSSNYFVGLGSLLTAQKYPTSFFHGGNNGTMYFDSFAKSAGFDKYFGASEYPNPADNDGTWGIFDEPFLQFMKTKLDETPQPFAAAVFTLSSHNPYRIPDQHKDKFPKGPHPILESVAYADYSLQRFFEEAEKQPWFKNTLFVITSDHTGFTYRAGNDNELTRFRIPILFYHPGYEWPKGIDQDQIVEQIDVMPSVMDFLGLENKEVNYLGLSVFVPGDRTATLYLDGRYFLVAKDYFLDWMVGGELKMYSITDAAQKEILQEPTVRKHELEARLKASIQYFNEGMWDNRIYYPSGK
ncbi:LTA synthase family protein [Bdellovibrio sp. HCB337]|uniref:LTA synthase family protein n=1 Tax=Bdellovibrio sp. HCB337 TaxID=3394358 RepID=UPI0039A6D98D